MQTTMGPLLCLIVLIAAIGFVLAPYGGRVQIKSSPEFVLALPAQSESAALR